ncbi:MAG: RsmD family RNA methyltransferase [Bacteroidia bacterium]|nr:RsmD family RNA methyltransferase [Bacteroidia bacterium]
MTIEEFEILTHDKIQDLIEANLYENPSNLALSQKYNDFPIYIVSQQLKYLQKSRKKIPSFYESCCIIPGIAFEQASSEQSAGMKSFSGESCLDLSTGLGVDVAHFSRYFQQVDTVEIDGLKVEVAKHNFRKLGIKNVNFHHDSSENYLKNYTGEAYDLIYLDPARRDKRGRRTFAPEDCQPNVFELLPLLLQKGQKILVKLSPLYDHVEAFRKFPQMSRFHIYSIDHEVKEVLLELDREPVGEKEILLKIHRNGITQSFHFLLEEEGSLDFEEREISYVWDADPAFYKARLTEQLLAKYFPDSAGFIETSKGFFFSSEAAASDFPGRIFKVKASLPYKPKVLKKHFKSAGIKRAEIIRRDFPFSTKDIRKQLGLDAGGETYLLACMIKGERKILICNRA